MTIPDFKNPVNILAFFTNEFGMCGCAEKEEVIYQILDLLNWIDMDTTKSYDDLYYGNVGIYYLLAGMLEKNDLITHGTSIRWPWLTPRGKDLLQTLSKILPEEIVNSKGIAYDDCWYGNIEND